jgi:threonine synthase
MNYISTRGHSPAIPFDDVMISALASDGGLYMPESWPAMSADEMAAIASRTYPEVALHVLKKLTGEAVPLVRLYQMIIAAYRRFDAPEVTPLVVCAT